MLGVIETGEAFITDISQTPLFLRKVILNLKIECFCSWTLDLKAILSKDGH